MIMQSNENEPK